MQKIQGNYIELSDYINQIHTTTHDEVNTIHHQNPLQSAVNFGIISELSEKVTSSREKLNLYKANDSTPTNDSAFFVRNNRTPQENAVFILHTENLIFLSMVERSGQLFVVGCLPCMAVSHPAMFYRPTVRSLAVDSENQYKESTQMYQFIFALMRTPKHCLKIRILADNEQQARACFTDGESMLFVGKINLSRKNLRNKLQSAKSFGTLSPQSQKTTDEPGNSNFLQLAHSTPNACFFMRNIRTPQENAVFVIIYFNPAFHSMVACSGKGFALCCFPIVTVFQPVTRYRQSLETLAVTPNNQQLELSSMIYKFLCINRTLPAFNLCVISINSTSEENARLCLSSDFRYVATIARINQNRKNTAKTDRTFESRKVGECVNIHSLPKGEDVGIIRGTETIHGNRNREQCGIFYLKFLSMGMLKMSAPIIKPNLR